MSMPHSVAQYIDFVEGISSFPIPHLSAKIVGSKAPGDTTAIVPQTLNVIYSIPPETAGSAPTTSVGVIEFQGESYSPQDSVNFSNDVNIKVIPVTSAHTIGPNDPTNPQIEAALDIEMVATVNPAATAWFWLEDGQGWLYQYVNHYFNTQDVPQVASISYGWSESDQCDIDPDECQSLGVTSQGYVWRVNAEFQKIALRGLSILVASGDSGANGRTDPDCTLPYLKPDYPAASPYITAVGATQLNNPVYNLQNQPPVCVGQGYACASGGQEVAVSYDVANFASGGGFANYAAMPSYQSKAVAAYLASGVALPPAGYFNTSGRGYPDVAAIGNAVLIDQGGVQPVGGTSASAPEWAAVVSILNQVAMKKTGKPLGFLNPLIYQIADACTNCFQDITIGDNICTEDGCSPGCQGFKCTKGWDPVTGWGSPNVKNLIAYLNAHL
jgi:tripeptidyl-peptidase-1